MNNINAGRDEDGRVFITGAGHRFGLATGGPDGFGLLIDDPETARAIALAVLRAELPEAWADLVEALAIMGRQAPTDSITPTHCQGDVMTVMADPAKFTPEELERIQLLHFLPNEYDGQFYSWYFGSA